MSFHVGQRVVCVEDRWLGEISPLKRGTVYTVTGGQIQSGIYTAEGEIGTHRCVFLAEVCNPDSTLDQPAGFNVRRFRPLDERRLDIFREMLVTPPKEPVSA